MAKSIKIPAFSDTSSFAFDRDIFNRLCGTARIFVLQMISSNFAVKPHYFAHKDDATLKLDNSILASWVDDDGESVSGIFRFEIKAKQGRKDLVCLRADFMVTYSIPRGIDAANAAAFCERSGLFAAYPYFRSYVSNVDALGSLELPLLPVLNSGPVRVAPSQPAPINEEENLR